MKTTVVRGAVVLALAAAAVGTAAGNAAASSWACATDPADATLNLGPGVPSVESSPPLSEYAGYGDSCDGLIADIRVPSTSSGGPGYGTSFSLYSRYAGAATGPVAPSDPDAVPVSRQICTYAGFAVGFTLYRKDALRHTFSYVGEKYAHGKWVEESATAPAHCRLRWTTNTLPDLYHPPVLGTTTYRVIGSAGSYGWLDYLYPVAVGAAHTRLL
jgi:hypothetical protein